MGLASTQKIAHRIVSVENSMQISSAMEMIATVKLQTIERNYQNSRRNLIELEFFQQFLMQQRNIEKHSFFQSPIDQPSLILLIGSDRGLAGAYNSNLYRELSKTTNNYCIFPIGKKPFQQLNKHSFASDSILPIEHSSIQDYQTISQNILKQWKTGMYSSIQLLYTKYQSILVQKVCQETIFPFSSSKNSSPLLSSTFDSNEEAWINDFAYMYLFGKLYASICEAQLSEWAMRRLAMNTSKQNAEELIEQLHLSYHRIRQGSITQEITEISSTMGGSRGKKRRKSY